MIEVSDRFLSTRFDHAPVHPLTMSVLDYTVERDRGTPPYWLDADDARILGLLAQITGPETDQAILAAVVRVERTLAEGTGEVPLAIADCLTLFTPFAEQPPEEQARAAETAALLLGPGHSADDIAATIRHLDAAIDRWASDHPDLNTAPHGAPIMHGTSPDRHEITGHEIAEEERVDMLDRLRPVDVPAFPQETALGEFSFCPVCQGRVRSGLTPEIAHYQREHDGVAPTAEQIGSAVAVAEVFALDPAEDRPALDRAS